jgi:hypothetical protein
MYILFLFHLGHLPELAKTQLLPLIYYLNYAGLLSEDEVNLDDFFPEAGAYEPKTILSNDNGNFCDEPVPIKYSKYGIQLIKQFQSYPNKQWIRLTEFEQYINHMCKLEAGNEI